jgi:hypothetical protein
VNFSLGLVILLISASQVAGITGMNLWCLACCWFLNERFVNRGICVPQKLMVEDYASAACGTELTSTSRGILELPHVCTPLKQLGSHGSLTTESEENPGYSKNVFALEKCVCQCVFQKHS